VKRIWLILAAIFLLTATAAASPINFRDGSVFGGALNQTSFSTTVDGLGLTFTPFPPGATLWWDDQDGFGVQFDYEQDEIEGDELLELNFSMEVYVAEIHIADLFNEWGYREFGAYRLDDQPVWNPFFADEDQLIGTTNGELTLLVGEWADTITFWAPGIIGCQNHDFTVAGVDVDPVPIPGAVWLLGSGLIGVIFFRRKRSVR
jgi:hypothetical protein